MLEKSRCFAVLSMTNLYDSAEALADDAALRMAIEKVVRHRCRDEASSALLGNYP